MSFRVWAPHHQALHGIPGGQRHILIRVLQSPQQRRYRPPIPELTEQRRHALPRRGVRVFESPEKGRQSTLGGEPYQGRLMSNSCQ
jgi:hypothetical protein